MDSVVDNGIPALRSVSRAGVRFSYRETGSGPALVLLHGIGSNSGSWAGQLAALGGKRRVVAWDAPGYGRSSLLASRFPSADDYARALARFLDGLEIGRCSLVGHSLGALMAASFAGGNLDRVERLILVGCAAGYGADSDADYPETIRSRLADLDTLGPAGLAEKRSARLLSGGASDDHRARVRRAMSEVTRAGYAAATHMLARADIFACAAAIEAPTLVLCGTADVITPEGGNRKIADAIGWARYRSLAGLGHACYVEGADAFNAAARDFLDEGN